MKLHLGCGHRRIEGWVNVDIAPSQEVDLVADVLSLPLDDGCADIIYASHLLEHLEQSAVQPALLEWRRVLTPGGVLRLAVPDFANIAKRYLHEQDVRALWGMLVGRSGLLAHHSVWDRRGLTEELEAAGFSDVRPWDWRATDHAGVDDFSQAYWPHLDKRFGMQMSLNLEATR